MSAFFHFSVAVGIITLGIWLHLFFGRGSFWRVRDMVADNLGEKTPGEWPGVVAVIPARNEAETIGQLMTSLARQDYPGSFSIVIVDDHSDDATADVARKAASESGTEERVRILSAAELPVGWTGKLWALNEGVSSVGDSNGRAPSDAKDGPPAYFWFTDADITHAPDTLRRLVTGAENDQLDLASLMVLLHAKSFPEKALIPAFLYFFLMLYPPHWIADEDLGTSGAAGGCILLKREALERVGGFASIRSEVIDDCALARAVKNSGGRVWMGLTRKSESLRVYGTFVEIRDLIARTAFTQLGYSKLLLAGTFAGMFLTYVLPVILLFVPDATARVLDLGAYLLMTLSFLPTVRFYLLSPIWVLSLPLIAAFYSYATLLSAVRYWLGSGGQWKSRAQAPRRN